MRACEVCGCTDDCACVDDLGQPCGWSNADRTVCTACA